MVTKLSAQQETIFPENDKKLKKVRKIIGTSN